MKFIPILFFLFTSLLSFSQSDVLKYAHQVVDTLASPSMHGRGYVNKGDSIAADYIKKELEKIDVKPIGKEFEQRFSFPVNAFPNKIELIITGKKLIPGKDFLANSFSGSSKGEGYAVLVDKNSKKISSKKFTNKILFIDTVGINEDKLKSILSLHKTKSTHPVFFIERNKLTNEISTRDNQRCFITILNPNPSLPRMIKLISYNIENTFIPNYSSQNILGYIKGTQYPDSFIVFSAHYDHLGQMGKDVYFPGANDNASGCAMLLNLAKYYSQYPPKYSVAFMAFGGEEVGLLGSKYYVEHPLFPLKQIKFLVNMDIMGTGDEGIKVVNATEHKIEFDKLVQLNSEKNLLPSVQPRGKAANSDHYFFEEAGVKTFFIYTLGGIKAYRDIYDRPETLPLTKFEEIFHLLIDFTDYLQK